VKHSVPPKYKNIINNNIDNADNIQHSKYKNDIHNIHNINENKNLYDNIHIVGCDDTIPNIDSHHPDNTNIHNERIRIEMPNDVSGDVDSPTQNKIDDNAGCNIENVTMTDADMMENDDIHIHNIVYKDKYKDINIHDIVYGDENKNKNICNNMHKYKNDNINININNNNNNNDINSHKSKSWSKSIAMYGTINNIPSFILFDSGAEGIFINESFINKHNIYTECDDDSRVGVMADGTTKHLNKIAKNINISVQEYYDNIDMHVLPIARYDAILGVPWHEALNAITHHRDRIIIINLFYNNNSVNKIILKQMKRDKKIHSNINNNTYYNDSILVSAVQMKRWMRIRSSYNNGVKFKQPPAMIYIIYIDTLNDENNNINYDDINNKYQKQYTSLYPDVCGDIPSGLPPQRNYDHLIMLENEVQSINQPAYRASASDNDEIRKQVNDMLDKGWIRPSTSSFASPVLLVKKHDGSIRMCVDYRALNKITVKDRYPLPHTDELTDRLSKAKYLTKLDLRAGYHQVRIADNDINKTAFITRYGLYEYLVMPFGLCNAPSTFMRMMNDILRPLLDVCVIVFIDDILIYSETEEQHHIDVCQVFDLLRQHKLYVKLSKCEFFKHEVEFLGHIVGNGHIKMCPSKISAILEWPTPSSITDIRSFIGLCNYYRKFIQGFSTITSPLIELTRNDIPFIWTLKQQSSFDQLKHAITSAPILQLPNQSYSWTLYTDASGYAIGGVLCQDTGNGMKPVVFLSRKLAGAELNCAVYEKEFYAIIYCLQQCQWYLQGNEVIIYTDHQSLKYFLSQKSLSSKQSRWIEFLSSFACKIEYKEGKYNVVADALSRRSDHRIDINNNTDNNNNNINTAIDNIKNSIRINNIICIDNIPCPYTNLFGISTFTLDDEYLHKIQEAYKDDEQCKMILQSQSNITYTIKNGYIYKADRLYIPSFDILKQPLLYEYHDSASSAHRGIASTHERIKRYFYWPNMLNDIEQYIRTCKECQQSKAVNQLKNGLLQPLPIPNNKFEDISMDFITHLPTTNNNNNIILVIVDRLTKYARFIAMSTKHNHELPAAEITAEAVFSNWCRIYDIPHTIVSDRDTQFTSKFWSTLFEKFNTKLKYSTAYHPQTDGQTERTNRTLEEILRSYLSPTQTDWDQWLSSAEIAYNNTYHSSTQQTPHELVFNQKRRSIADYISLYNNTPNKAITTAADRIQQAKQCIERAQQRQIREANKHRRNIQYNLGDLVFISTEHLNPTGSSSNKLMYKYIGPYRITRRISNVTYEVLLPRNSKLHNVFYVNRLRKFYPRLTQFADDDGRDIEPPPTIIDNDYEWEIEDIINHRMNKKKQREYLVKWSGYTSIHNSWEPIDNLMNAKDIIDKYHKNVRLQSIDIDVIQYREEIKSNRRQYNIQSMASSMNCITNLPHMMLCLSIQH
jgi:hypothetical protein